MTACCSLAYLLNESGRAVNSKQTLISQLMSIVNIKYYSLECWQRNIISRCYLRYEDVFDIIIFFKYLLNILYFLLCDPLYSLESSSIRFLHF